MSQTILSYFRSIFGVDKATEYKYNISDDIICGKLTVFTTSSSLASIATGRFQSQITSPILLIGN